MTRSALQTLKRIHRTERWVRPLWAIAAVAAVDLLFIVGGADGAWRIACIVAGVLAACVLATRRKPTLLDTARRLDRQLSAHNRFEAFAQLGADDGPLPRAISEEIEMFMRDRTYPKPYRAWSALAGCALLMAVELGAPVELWRTELAPKPPEKVRVVETEPRVESVEPELPATVPAVVLRWIQPSECAVADAGSVPLLAESESEAALERVALHASHNGEFGAPEVQGDVIAPGTHAVPLTLNLEALRGRPFEISVYFLSAERRRSGGTAREWPAVYSPLQLAQIRGEGSDPSFDEPPSDTFATDDAQRLLFGACRLKLAQIALLRNLFNVSHGRETVADKSSLTSEARRVWQLAMTLQSAADRASAPVAVGEPLRQARAELERTWDETAAGNWSAAFSAATRALTLIGRAEGIFAQRADAEAEKQAERAKASAADGSAERAALPARETTDAGKLEALARQQTALVKEIAAGGSALLFSQQDSIARALPALAVSKDLSAQACEFIAPAVEEARLAADHLRDGDEKSALEPAARTAQLLNEAVAASDSEARRAGGLVLEKTQTALNRAALDVLTTGDLGAAAEQLASARRTLNDAAVRQQLSGSAEAAEAMVELARAIEQSGASIGLLPADEKQPKRNDVQPAKEVQSPPSNAPLESPLLANDEEESDDDDVQKEKPQPTPKDEEPPPARPRRKEPPSQPKRGIASDSDSGGEGGGIAPAGTSAAAPDHSDDAANPGDQASTAPSDGARAEEQTPKLADAISAAKVLTQLAQKAADAQQAIVAKKGGEPPTSPNTESLQVLRDRLNAPEKGKAEDSRTLFEKAQAEAQKLGESLPMPTEEGSGGPQPGPKAELGGAPSQADSDPRLTIGSTPKRDLDEMGDFVNNDRFARVLSAAIDRVLVRSRRKTEKSERDAILNTEAAADAPPEYRAAVADYFERISRAERGEPSKP